MPFSWTEQFAVGHEAIDRQHRGLVDAIVGIDAAIRAGADAERLAPLVRALRRAAEEHFRHENSILRQIRTGTFNRRSSKAAPRRVAGAMADSAFDRHTAEHALMLAALDDIAQAPPAAMADQLKSWFVDHAIKHDSRLKAIFQAMG